MSKAIFYKSSMVSVFCIATLLFVFSIPMISHGQGDCSPYEVPVSVAANKINITSLDNTDHGVVVHTLQDYLKVTTSSTRVFVNDACEIDPVWQRMDSNGNLDIYFQLDDLKENCIKYCEDCLKINDEFNILRVEGVASDCEFWGESYMHIVGKQGPSR